MWRLYADDEFDDASDTSCLFVPRLINGFGVLLVIGQIKLVLSNDSVLLSQIV